ncbi:unnamed protein product [Ceutorhynchus assimilis]|uniref:Uncharacterized protein n=1 Tax=Ceutorhynchus assimilis TaxID=467358 RepID=A0A9P0DEZ7_9CUCU|nr:unnamed protein product [Ceutorhynchus assimilis]
MNLRVLFVALCAMCFESSIQAEDGYTFINKVRFPFSQFFDPFMGLIVAFDIKLVPSEIDLDMSWNIEANYLLPQNETQYTFPPIIPADSDRRLFDRSMLYKMFEAKLDEFSKSYGGKNCFLRVLCEMSRYTTKDTDVLGDIVHIILSPTSSLNSNLSPKYETAETYGKKYKHCKKYSKKCPIDILSYFSVLGELLNNRFF